MVGVVVLDTDLQGGMGVVLDTNLAGGIMAEPELDLGEDHRGVTKPVYSVTAGAAVFLLAPPQESAGVYGAFSAREAPLPNSESAGLRVEA